MNKRFFLMIVPAVLALSSYQTSVKKAIETAPISDINQAIEDTYAHEEIFGKSVLSTKINTYKELEPISNSAPAIGLQTKVDNKGTIDTDDDTISIRFVAAIETNDITNTSAVWTRTMYNTDGSFLKETANKASTTAYTSLASANSNPLDPENADVMTIEQFNSSQGGTNYTHFVVYTMMNIPLETYANCYLNAYLTVNGETTSKLVSTSVDQTTQLSFNVDDNGAFIIKKTASGYEKVNSGNFYDGNEYIAQFAGLSISSDESFVIVNKTINSYSVYGYDAVHHADNNDTYFTQLNSSQFAKSKENKSYFLFLDSANNDIKVHEASQATFYLQVNNGWQDGSSRFVISIGIDGESNRCLYDMERVGVTSVYSSEFYFPLSDLTSNPIAFARFSSANLENSWSNKTASTSDMPWPTGNNNLYDLANEEWSIYNASDFESNFTILSINSNSPSSPVEIHTQRQAEYLAYDGDYRTIPESSYPDGNQHISNPEPTILEWDYDVPNGKVVDYYSIKYGKEPDLSDGYVLDGSNETSINLINPYLGVNYYQIIATFTNAETESSPIYNFFVDTTCPRNLNIDGMTNCRDLGGRTLEDGGTIKQGLIYRTSGRNQAGLVISEETRRELVDHLGVKNEIYIAERGSGYACNLAGTTVQNFYMDYSATDGSSNLSRNTEPLKKFFNFLADSSNYPLFFHCKIGTDRTGLCGTMLNGLLGVSENEIYQDYLFSNFGNIQSKRYIGEKAGHDNILRYTEYIKTFSGATFKNKVYNLLLSIGISRSTLDAVIANLTDGPTATGNNSGQITAFGDELTPSGVEISTYDNSVYSDYPAQYYVLTDPSTSISYSFNTAEAFNGQIVAYMGNGNSSSYDYIGDAINLSLDGNPLTIKTITYLDAGMGRITTSYARYMYYPVTICITSFSVGNHTITITGNYNTMNVAGISIFNAATATCYHEFGSENILVEPTCHSTGLLEHTCSICHKTIQEEIPTLQHNWGSYNEVVAATCEHSGYYERECSVCHETEGYVENKLQHNWGEVVANNASGISGDDSYVATTVRNCAYCNKSSLRWSALDYDKTLSSAGLDDNGSTVRFKSATVENSGGSLSTGSHIIYKVNVTEEIQNAGLSFKIQNTGGNGSTAPVFNKISGDSANGYYYDGNSFVNLGKRYGLKVNGVEYFLDDDDYGNQKNVVGWFDWPVSFPLQSGVNTIDIFAYAGYRAYMYEYQLTGFSYVEQTHSHTLSDWYSDDYSHWKNCTGNDCIYPEGTHLEENAHDWDWGIVTTEPTCTNYGVMTYTCQTCGRTRTEQIAMSEHNWDSGEVTIEPTCDTDGEMTYHCQNDGCNATKVENIPSQHNWGSATPIAGEAGETPYNIFECQRDGCNAIKIEIAAIDGTLANGSSIKNGTPAGFVKLNSNGNSISYNFNYSGETATAKIYQRAIFDSWTSTNNPTSSYSTQGTGVNGCNFRLEFNGDVVDMSDTMYTQYKDMLNGGEDVGLGNTYSRMAECLIGTIELRNGLNEFTYFRQASMNLLVHDYVIVIE